MIKLFKKTCIVCLSFLTLPHILAYIAFNTMGGGGKISMDIDAWKRHKGVSEPRLISFVLFILRWPEFRSLFYHRIGKVSLLLYYLPPRKNLHIWTPNNRLGGGLYIGHGWGTVINAKSIGNYCLVAQNSTIGSRHGKEPELGDNVSVWAHAVVLGNIKIGDNSEIGAGAVIVKSVPENSVVVPASSRIIKMDEERVNIRL